MTGLARTLRLALPTLVLLACAGARPEGPGVATPPSGGGGSGGSSQEGSRGGSEVPLPPGTRASDLAEADVARAVIPTYDASTGRGAASSQGAGGSVVRSTRGSPAPDDGARVRIARVDLADGRQAVWLTTHEESRIPPGTRYFPGVTASPEPFASGFLALVRNDASRVAIDAIGVFVNQTGADRSMRMERLGEEPVYVTARVNGLGLKWARLWLVRGGELLFVEELMLHGDSVTDDTKQQQDTSMTFEGDRIHMHRHTLWKKEDVVRNFDEDAYYALEADHLVRRWPTEKK
jgi:hypothetical protein